MIYHKSEIVVHYDFTEAGWQYANAECIMDRVDKILKQYKGVEAVYFGGNSCMNPYVTVTIDYSPEIAATIEAAVRKIVNDNLLVVLIDI